MGVCRGGGAAAGGRGLRTKAKRRKSPITTHHAPKRSSCLWPDAVGSTQRYRRVRHHRCIIAAGLSPPRHRHHSSTQTFDPPPARYPLFVEVRNVCVDERGRSLPNILYEAAFKAPSLNVAWSVKCVGGGRGGWRGGGGGGKDGGGGGGGGRGGGGGGGEPMGGGLTPPRPGAERQYRCRARVGRGVG